MLKEGEQRDTVGEAGEMLDKVWPLSDRCSLFPFVLVWSRRCLAGSWLARSVGSSHEERR